MGRSRVSGDLARFEVDRGHGLACLLGEQHGSGQLAEGVVVGVACDADRDRGDRVHARIVMALPAHACEAPHTDQLLARPSSRATGYIVGMTLKDGHVAARIPVRICRGPEPSIRRSSGSSHRERPGGLRYECASGEFSLFESAGAASGDHTQMAWEVEDFDATVAELQARGVSFEEFGSSRSRATTRASGRGENAAWFRDVDGNLFGIGQPIR